MAELVPLSKSELSELHKHEAIIERGQKTFIEVGNSLAAIKENQLYKAEYKNFDDYCRSKWGWKQNYAGKLIAAAEVVNNLVDKTGTIVPVCETQVRPLTQLPEEKQAAAWQDAVDLAEERGKPVTAAIVEEVVKLHVAQAEPYEEEEGEEEDEPAEEETWEGRMKESNKNLERLARSITGLIADAQGLNEPHMESYGRINILDSQLKTAAGTVRAAKGAGQCVYCIDGNQNKCKWCRGTGWLDKQQLESAPKK